MAVQEVVAENNINCLKPGAFSACSPERKATNNTTVVLKEKVFPELYKRHRIIAASYLVILSHRDIQVTDDTEPVLEVVRDDAYRNVYELQRRFSSWARTVSGILGWEIEKGTFVDKVV